MKAKILLCILTLLVLFLQRVAWGQITYYSRASGNWNNSNTWSTTGHAGSPAATPPSATDNVIIGAGHTVTSTLATDLLTHPSVTVDAGSTLVLQNGNTNLVSSFTINGKLRLEGGALNGTTINFNNGSTYEHARNGGTIPTATWQPNSTCLVTGVTNTMPTGWASQNFGNLTWNCIEQTTYLAFNANFDIQETFRVENTRNGGISLGLAVSNSGSFTVTTKNFIMDNPTPNSAAFYPYGGNNASDVGTLEVKENITILSQITGVLSGIGKSRILLSGTSNSTFHYNASFSFYSNALWEIEVAKAAGVNVTFTSPINFIGFGPASGTPVSSLKITSGTAAISAGTGLEVGIIEGGGLLSMADNSSLYLGNVNSLFNNTFNGTLIASINNSRIFYHSPVPQNIFVPTTGSYHNIILQNSGAKNLTSDISLTGDWTNNATGTFNAGINTVTFSGTGFQTIGGSQTTQFHNLNINNDVSLSVNTRFNGQLSIANDKYLTLAASDLIALDGSIIAGGVNKYIVTSGAGAFVFRNESASAINPNIFVPLGRVAPSKYAGINLPINNLATNSEVKIRALEQGVSPAPAITSSNRVDYVWEINLPTGASINTSTNTIFFYTGSVVGDMSTGGSAYYHNGTNWVAETTSSSTNGSTIFTSSPFSGAGTRYYAAFALPADYYTLANDAIWSVNSNLWSTDGTNPCNCSPNGVAGANVRIRHNASIPMGANVAAGTIINIEQPVTLTADFAFTAAQLLGVSGARLAVSFPGLPFISGVNSFATTSGTIVEFAGGAGTIPNQFGTVNYKNLIIGGTGVKKIGGNTTIEENLTILSGTFEPENFNLSVTGSTVIAAGASFLDNTTGGTNEFATLTNNGTFGATGGTNTSSFNFLGDVTNNAGASFNIDCNCTYSFNKPSPPLVITPNSPMTFGSVGGGNGSFLSNTIIENGQAVTFNVTNAANLLIGAGVTVTNNNTAGVQINGNGALQGTNGASTWLQGVNAILGYASDQVPMSTGVLDATTNNNIVNYNRAGNQSLKATDYRTLQVTGNGVKSIPSGGGNIFIANSFTIPDAITFQVNNNNFTANEALTINGIWEDNETGGTNFFKNTITVSNTGTMRVNGANTSFFAFEGDILNQGTFNLANSTQWRFNANLTIKNESTSQMSFAESNSGTGQVNANVTILDGVGNVALFTNSGSPISGSGSITNQLGDNGSPTGRKLIMEVCNVPFTNAAGAVVEYRAQTDISNKTLTAPNNSFIYTQDVTSINPSTYHNVFFTNFSNFTLGGNIAVNGNLTIDNTSTLNAAANNINIRGNWIGNGTFTAGTSSVIFDGANLQTITTNATSNFNNLNINNTAHVAINNNVRSASVTLTQGRLQTGNFDFILMGSPATNQITQTFTNASTSYIETNGTGNLIRNNLLAGTSYVFPVGDATAIRHFTITLPSSAFVRGRFLSSVSPTPPPANTDIAAGRWLLQGANGATVSFYNSGATGFSSKVYRFDGTNWTNAGIATNFNSGVYTATPLDFLGGETFTIFGQSTNHIVLESTFMQTSLPDGSILLYAETNYGLLAKFISTNTNVAKIINDNILVINYNNTDEFTDILAFNEGANPIPASDTLRVMRIYNFGYINQIENDLEKRILLYPNPTTDEIFVSSLDNSLRIEKITILNALGQSVAVKMIENKLRLAHLPAGVYVAQIHTSQGAIRKKVTKR